MKAILIDPFFKLIVPFEIPPAAVWNPAREVAWIRDKLRCGDYDHVRMGSDGYCMLVDSNGLLTNWDRQAFFRFCGGLPIAGRALFVRYDLDGILINVEENARNILDFHVDWVKPEDVVIPGESMSGDKYYRRPLANGTHE